VYLIPKDLPSTIAATTPQFAADKQEGIKEDAEFGASAGDTQSNYTPYVQAIKSHNSTYARDGLDYVSTVFFRKEAQVQGVNTVKVWDCSLQCYDQRLISTGGSAVEGQYAWLSFLPFEDKGHNDELDAFLQYNKKPDGFGAQAWVAGEAFAEAVKKIVAKSGPQRHYPGRHAGGDQAGQRLRCRRIRRADRHRRAKECGCLIGMQVKSGKFVRVDPVEPGKFDCNGRDHHDHDGPGEGVQGMSDRS
jgi:hypothetical protein